MLLDASTPTTQPLGTRRAISEVILPSPHPTSSTRSQLVSSRACNTSAAMACCKLERSRYSTAFHSVVGNVSSHFDLIVANGNLMPTMLRATLIDLISSICSYPYC